MLEYRRPKGFQTRGSQDCMHVPSSVSWSAQCSSLLGPFVADLQRRGLGLDPRCIGELRSSGFFVGQKTTGGGPALRGVGPGVHHIESCPWPGSKGALHQ